MRQEAWPAGVGKTALGVAVVRAQESRRPDRLFDDPYAAAFAAAAPGAFAAEERAAAAGPMSALGQVFAAHAVLRTRFFDDFLLDAARGGIRQIVLVAAGLDTRSYRLDWPRGTRLYELDLPEVLAFKQRVLDGQHAVARCHRTALAADLRMDWATPLTGAGYRRREPAAWLVEGLLIYLSAAEADALLTTIGELSAPDSVIAFEYEGVGTDPLRLQARSMPAMAEYVAMWKGGLPDPAGWLREHGWSPVVHDRAEVADRYGRNASGSGAGGFVTAVR
jgi:methyltransferase (TIGR00027 family)